MQNFFFKSIFSSSGRLRNETVGESKQSDTWDAQGNKKPLTSKYFAHFFSEPECGCSEIENRARIDTVPGLTHP
jgi:hypothetical protein